MPRTMNKNNWFIHIDSDHPADQTINNLCTYFL